MTPAPTPSQHLRWMVEDARGVIKGRWWRAPLIVFNPTFAPIAWYRINHAAHLRWGKRWSIVRLLLSPLNPLFTLFMYAELDYRPEIGPGLRILHPQMGVVISGEARAGRHLILAGGNTIMGGARLGNGVQLGINAVVLPDVTIGDGVIIGAGAVVVRDYPGPGTLVGNPARPTAASVQAAGEQAG